MNFQNQKKNVWASTAASSSPFGLFKNILPDKNVTNQEDIENFDETLTILKEAELISLNAETNTHLYNNRFFELLNKYKDFILEKELITKLKSLEAANKLMQKGVALLKNLQNNDSLKNFDNRSNYILISYEIRKVFLEILRVFNVLPSEDPLFNQKNWDSTEKELQEIIKKVSESIDGFENYIESLKKLSI